MANKQKQNGCVKKSKAEMMKELRDRRKADPAKHAEYLARERDRYQARKQQGKIKTIRDLNERDQRSLRKKWRKEKCALKQAENRPRPMGNNDLTPPPTPEMDPGPEPQPSHQKLAGRRKVRRESRKAYRVIDKQKETIKRLQSQNRNLRRRMKRLEKVHVEPVIGESPRGRVNKILSGHTDTVRKALLFGEALSSDIGRKY
jgi:hypothetical protein